MKNYLKLKKRQCTKKKRQHIKKRRQHIKKREATCANQTYKQFISELADHKNQQKQFQGFFNMLYPMVIKEFKNLSTVGIEPKP